MSFATRAPRSREPLVSPGFEAELIEAARYLEHQRGDFGRQFLNEVEAAIGTIMEAPAR